MGKVLFLPVNIVGSLLAGLAASKLFEFIWSRIDDQEPPSPEHREISMPKLAVALLLEGAIFRLARGVLDHAGRRVFYSGTHRWPGEERPEPT